MTELCKGVRCVLVDLGESFQTYIFLQILASIPLRTSPVKFVRPSNAAADLIFRRRSEGPRRIPLHRHRNPGVGTAGRVTVVRVLPLRARSRLYRGRILQVNMRLKALAEIYTMHLCTDLKSHFSKKLLEFCQNSRTFSEILLL